MTVRHSGECALLLGRRMNAARRRPIGFVPQQEASVSDADDWVIYNGTSHGVTIGPTGAGKTAQLIANALLHRGTLVVFDSKGEIYEATARRRREMGQQVHVIDLRDVECSGTGSLNPLDIALRSGSENTVIARSLACSLVARTGSERDNFWVDSAETLIAGAISRALTLDPSRRNLASVFDLFNDDDTEYQLAVLLADTERQLSRVSRTAFRGFLELSERDTRPSVLAQVRTALRLWDSELIRTLTNTTSIDLESLIAGEPVSLYFIVPFIREAYRPLLRLWFSGLLGVLMQREEVPALTTLILSDETASFGKVESFVAAATQARSYGVQLWTHWQNLSQIQASYGAEGAHTLIDNAGAVQLLGAPNRRAAQEFAALVGGIDADEIMAMGPHEQVLLLDGNIQRLRRIRYFEEARFAGQYDPVKKPRPLFKQGFLPFDANDGHAPQR